MWEKRQMSIVGKKGQSLWWWGDDYDGVGGDVIRLIIMIVVLSDGWG